MIKDQPPSEIGILRAQGTSYSKWPPLNVGIISFAHISSSNKHFCMILKPRPYFSGTRN
jgi:hypothetical protein